MRGNGHLIGESVFQWNPKYSDILFPYRSPSPRPHPDPTQHPEADPKRTQNRPETEPNGAKRSRNGAKRSRNGPKSSFSGWDGRGVCRGRGGWGGCKGKRISLPKYGCKGTVTTRFALIALVAWQY